jgi:hypothetical protein
MEQSVPIPGTVSRGCALQCAILSSTVHSVGTHTLYWVPVPLHNNQSNFCIPENGKYKEVASLFFSCRALSEEFFSFPQVREFSVTDIQPYPVKLVWETSKKEDVGEMEVFPRSEK